ncbi:MAG: hypothetical protein V7742_00440 [Halioglobus sp.]
MASIFVAEAPFLHDYAEWVFQGKILALKLTDPAAVSDYRLYSYPVPYLTSHYLMAVWHLLFDPILASKLYLVSYIFGSLVAYKLFLNRYVPDVSQRPTLCVLLICLCTFSSFYWYGYIGYQIAFLIFVVFISLYRESSSVAFVVVASVLAFLTHATIYFQVCIYITLAVMVFRYPLKHFFALMPSIGLSIWFLLGRFGSENSPHAVQSIWGGLFEASLYKVGMVTMHGPFKNFLDPEGASLLEEVGVLYWFGVLANILTVTIIGLIYLLASIRIIKRLNKGFSHGQPELLFLFSVVLVIIYIIAPYNFFGIVHPGGRAILPFLVTALAIISVSGLRLPRLLGTGVGLVTLWVLLGYSLLTAPITTFEELSNKDKQRPPESAAGSVLAYNQWLYRNTDYKYYNYRIFVLAGRYRQLEIGDYKGLGFKSGALAGFETSNK